MNHRNDNTQVEVKRDWKYVFKCYLRFLQFGASKIFQLFKYCVHKFGAESIFLLGNLFCNIRSLFNSQPN